MFLEYGVNQHNELVHIEQAGRGLTDLTCPYCGGALLARKGEVKIHHFAHAEETCREVSDRDDSLLRLPFYDKFDLGLSPKEIKFLSTLHDGKGTVEDKNQQWWLENNGFIKEAWSTGYVATYELTNKGKIPFGATTLQKFGEIQLERMTARHDELVSIVHKAWRVKPETLDASLVDLGIYRAQIRRIFGAKLYFLEVQHSIGTLYKVGITSRDLATRIEELHRDLSGKLTEVKINPLRTLAHRGSIEFYFKHRYKANRHMLGNLTEYFAFSDRKKILSDLSRLGDYEPDEWIVGILKGQPSDIETQIIEEREEAEATARAEVAREARSQATKAGMQRAAEQGIHVGRPKGSTEDDAKLLAKYAEVVELLQEGWSLRDINYETGVAINTIRKVKAAKPK